MPLKIPVSSEEIRTQFLRDIELEARKQGIDNPPIQPKSTWFVLATGISNAALITTSNVAIAQRDGDVLRATGAGLDEQRKGEGLPELPAQGASGYIRLRVFGSTHVDAGAQLIAKKNGKRYEVIYPVDDPSNGEEIKIRAKSTGEDTDLRSGEILTWANTPPNLSAEVAVSNTLPVTGGRNDETDEEKRERIMSRRRHPPAGGNWSHLVELAKSIPAVQGAYVYPALGGASSIKVVVTKDIIPSDNDYTRIPSDGILRAVREVIQGELPDGNALVIQATAEESTSVSVTVDIPDSKSSGGNGQGWLNATPWPPLDGGDTEVTVSGVTSNKVIMVDAATTTEPVDGQTRIGWFSPTTQSFITRLVVSSSGSSGSWSLTLDRPLVDARGNGVAVGDYISPDAANLPGYGTSLSALMAKLGPGENTSDPNRIGDGRSLRHPLLSDKDPASIGNSILRRLQEMHPEIVDIELSAVSTTTPSIPGTVEDAPNVLKLDNFGVYPA
jgi:hypothetical protein